jgi:hypothetical protein
MRNRSSGPVFAFRLGLLAAGLLLGAQALADSPTMYRWVDKDGHVHYDDSGQAPGSKPVNPRVMSGDGSTPPATAAAPGALTKQSACKAKADDYNRYKNAAGISQTDATGAVHSLSDDEKNKIVEGKRQELVALCGADAANTPAAAPPAADPAAAQPPQ